MSGQRSSVITQKISEQDGPLLLTWFSYNYNQA